ncbi:MAG: hypothetical protein K2Q45_03885 [Nitrosomonas sp.]|nr:hypothetical protein [Nitrosomonas sp.]
MKKPILVVAFDCEGCGPNHIKHGLKSLGVCAGLLDGTIAYKFRLDFQPLPGQVMDAETFENFYQKQNPGLLEALNEFARPAEGRMHQFNEFLKLIEKDFDLYMLTDAPSYDASLVNYYLQYFDFLPLHFTRSGEFRPVHDADSYARGLTRDSSCWVSNADLIKKYDIAIPEGLVAHYPENDAEIIYRIHIALVKQK